MSSLIGSAADISLTLHHRTALTANTVKALDNASSAVEVANGSTAAEDTKAREAASKFEALLIHNMLKSMRKTTMTENKSNDRAIYDDMLDEKLADTMMKAGGMGIADQIVTQIQQQRGTRTTSAKSMNDAQRLRELARHIQRPADAGTTTSSSMPSGESTSIAQLRMAANLWTAEQASQLSQRQHDFVKPLMPHAQRNAQKLGTSPNAILAIAALETGWGRSLIKDQNGSNSHNLFGIKAAGSDNRYATTLTTEYIEGSPQKLQARFKTYTSEADAVDGFADFILANPRYSTALQHAGDPERFLQELQNAGYATDPRYADKAISIMRQISRNPLPL